MQTQTHRVAPGPHSATPNTAFNLFIFISRTNGLGVALRMNNHRIEEREMSQSTKSARFVALGVLIALCHLVLSLPTTAQQNKLSFPRYSDAPSQTASGTRSRIKLHKYVDPAGAFQFTYSDLLVRCPDNSCDAYFPMCENRFSEESTTLSCFAYKRSKMRNRPTFEAGTFSVANLKDLDTQKECTGLPEGEYFDESRKSVAVILNGVSFKQFELDEDMMSQRLERQVYRTFHRGKCYELSVKIAAISPGVVELGTRKEFSETDRKEVRVRLDQSLYSFKFLK